MNEMGRQSVPFRTLNLLCTAKSLDPDMLLIRARIILKLYRSVASVTQDKIEMTVKEASTLYKGDGSYIDDIRAGLSYLVDFEPEYRKKDFETKVSMLFETHWMIELMNRAVENVRNHLDNGSLYFNILYKSYFDKHIYLNDDLVDYLDIAYSTFFDYKREATLLFGIYLWGYGIPRLYRNLSDISETQHATTAD